MHTREQMEHAAKLAEDFDPSDVPMDETSDLRTIAEAVDSVRTAEARVRELVATARADKRSWGEIGVALGVSRQAARERFGDNARQRPRRHAATGPAAREQFREAKERTVARQRAKARDLARAQETDTSEGPIRSTKGKTRVIAAAEEAIRTRR